MRRAHRFIIETIIFFRYLFAYIKDPQEANRLLPALEKMRDEMFAELKDPTPTAEGSDE